VKVLKVTPGLPKFFGSHWKIKRLKLSKISFGERKPLLHVCEKWLFYFYSPTLPLKK